MNTIDLSSRLNNEMQGVLIAARDAQLHRAHYHAARREYLAALNDPKCSQRYRVQLYEDMRNARADFRVARGVLRGMVYVTRFSYARAHQVPVSWPARRGLWGTVAL